MTGRLALIFPLLLEAVALTDSVTVKPGVANDIKKSVKTRQVEGPPSVVTYSGKSGKAYDDSEYVRRSKRIYAVAEEGLDVAAHPSYAIQSPNGSLLLSGDSFGDGSGRGWANLFDDSARLKWAWHSGHDKFDAVLAAAVLPDETVVLGGTRSILSKGGDKARWELLLVSISPDGTERWSTTLAPKPPTSTCTNCWSVMYWMDVDPRKGLLIMGGVVDHQPGADTIAWKSGGGQPDAGGVPGSKPTP
mmetsp:Transcript_29428/g.59261  ORF Transcript_29428/g.59261 Transcript_29428/m.59261 type:complete len:247 (-) Transcript_29428:1357-2097(-)